VLRTDYFEPAGIWAVNVAFLVATGSVIAWCAQRISFGSALVAGMVIVGGSTLYFLPYDSQIDSLYVLFSFGFVAAAIRMVLRPPIESWRLWGLRLALYATWFGAVTSKEVAVIVPGVAAALVLAVSPRVDRTVWSRLLRVMAPFATASLVFLMVYVTTNPPAGSDPNHTARPGIDKLADVRDMLFWGVGLRAPGSQRPNWESHFGGKVTLLAGLILLLSVAALALVWREIGVRRIALAIATSLGVGLIVGMLGSVPYHAFPLVVLYSVGVLVTLSRAVRQITNRLPRVGALASIALIGVGLLQLGLARSIYADAVSRGPQAAFLASSTELFAGADGMGQVRDSTNPLLIFEDCLGQASDPLHFYARAASGTQLVVVDLRSARPAVTVAVDAALSTGRPVFIAACTGTANPWYRVTQLTSVAEIP